MYGGLAALLVALAAWGPHSGGVLGLGMALLLGSQALMSFGTLLRILYPATEEER